MKIWWTSCHQFQTTQLWEVRRFSSGNCYDRHLWWGAVFLTKIEMSYVEPELIKQVEAPMYHPGPRPVPKPRKSQTGLKHSITEAAEHSLQVAVQEFKKIWEPKILKLKVGYSASATLIFNSWIKDIDMCVWDHILTEHEAVQLVKRLHNRICPLSC